MRIDDVIREGIWVGNVEQCQVVDTFAREYPWDGPVEDPEFAAAEVASRLCDRDVHPEAESRLRAALSASAERS